MSLPTVYIGVPTGYMKEYAILRMLTEIRNLDYPPDKLKLCIAVTLFPDEEERVVSEQFLQHVQGLLDNAAMPFETKVISTQVRWSDLIDHGPYCAVVLNLHALRIDFLKDARWERFLVLGGDNPPPRNLLKKLVKCKGDVISALMQQRPIRAKENEGPVTIIWKYYWHIRDLETMKLEPSVKNELRRAWLEFGFLKYPTDLEREGELHDVAFGSGCSLVKRKVLEHFGYVLGVGNHSEDLHFCQQAQLHGFQTTLDLTTGCGHFDPDGSLY